MCVWRIFVYTKPATGMAYVLSCTIHIRLLWNTYMHICATAIPTIIDDRYFDDRYHNYWRPLLWRPLPQLLTTVTFFCNESSHIFPKFVMKRCSQKRIGCGMWALKRSKPLHRSETGVDNCGNNSMYVCMYVCMYVYYPHFIRVRMQTYVNVWMHTCAKFSNHKSTHDSHLSVNMLQWAPKTTFRGRSKGGRFRACNSRGRTYVLCFCRRMVCGVFRRRNFFGTYSLHGMYGCWGLFGMHAFTLWVWCVFDN